MTMPIFAAVIHQSGQAPGPVLAALAEGLKCRGINVHGLLQEEADDHSMDAIDIRTGERIPIRRPTEYEWNNRICSLDLSQLATATMALRRALEAQADVVIVERFGKAEKDGDGLADELLELMASGIPTLVSVSERQRDAWLQFSGGLGAELPCERDALMKWCDTNV